ncbi:hypothetical protein Tco_0828382 [Tanacetum coccineum]
MENPLKSLLRRYKPNADVVKGAPNALKYQDFITTRSWTEAKLQEGRLPELTKARAKARQRVAKQRITQTFSPESMISFPPLGEEDGTEGPMIIKAEMGGYFIHRKYVDGGSSSEILKARSKENPGSSVHSSRNAKIPSDRQNSHITEQHDYSTRVAIHPEYSEQTVAIGSTLTEEGRKELCGLLRCNLDVFARKPADMTGVPHHIAEHMLNIHEGCLPVRQKKWGQAPGRNKAIYKEVEKLVNADIMKEVHYHSWL